jgi:hypothetical protein
MTTQRYMHLSPAALDAAIRLLEAGTPSVPLEPTGRRRELEAKTRERIEEKGGGGGGRESNITDRLSLSN